jgi:hypothetical protein
VLRRVAVGAPLAALFAWLVVESVHQVVTGSPWIHGVPNPLPVLLFFLGPPIALAGIAMLALARTDLPLADRLLVSAGASLLGLVVLHVLLSGRTWVWNVPDLTPPLLFLLGPLALAAALAPLTLRGAATRRRPALVAWALTLLALALGVGQAGLNPPALTGGIADGPAPQSALRVVSWDTLYWDSLAPDRFYQYLKAQQADIYLLQEYRQGEDARLRRELPGYQIATVGDLITVSRFPIVANLPFETNPQPPPGTDDIFFLKGWKWGAMRTDVLVGGRVLSAYNVHFYDQFYLNAFPLAPAFYDNIRGLDEGRRVQLDMVLSDVRQNPNPLLVSGNFNLLPNMGDMQRFAALKDAGRAGRSLYPTSLRFFGPSFWLMDRTFTTQDVGVHQFALRSPDGLSSHDLQETVISVPGT